MARLATLIAITALTGCGSSGGQSVDAASIDARGADASIDAAPSVTAVDPGTASAITVVGTPAANGGLSDVALLYPAGAASGVMTYTAVAYSQTAIALTTRIASSTDHGATWTYVADVNHVAATMLQVNDATECPSGTCPGFIVNEVSSVIEDPTDPATDRRWKVFTHRYFVSTQTGQPTIRYQYGHIAMYTAAAPAGPWSAPQPVVGWPSSAPFSSQGASEITTGIPGMSDCAVLTEPSAMVSGNDILLAVGCIALPVTIRVELLASSDHGATFHHVGTLVGANDAVALGGSAPRVNAANLFEAAGVPYVLVSPGDASGAYLNCALLPLDAQHAILRNADGSPHVLRFFDAPGQPQNGACSFAEGATATGFVMNIPTLTPVPLWRVYRTGVTSP
jgi:hypothetical protein